ESDRAGLRIVRPRLYVVRFIMRVGRGTDGRSRSEMKVTDRKRALHRLIQGQSANEKKTFLL
ncbi:hypothetical protein BDY21DRAFT_337981, partial [Lineolata rhizophorae]